MIDLHNLPAASTPDLVAAMIGELGALLAVVDDTSPAGVIGDRCMSIAFAIQSRLATVDDMIREET